MTHIPAEFAPRIRQMVADGGDWTEIAGELGVDRHKLATWGQSRRLKLTDAGLAKSRQRMMDASAENQDKLADERAKAQELRRNTRLDMSPAAAKRRLAELIAEGQQLAGKGERLGA